MSGIKRSWNFAACKAPDDVHACSILIRDTEDLVRQFLAHHFLNDATGYIFYFHLANEACDVGRPLCELFTTYRPGWLNGERVLIHWKVIRQQLTLPKELPSQSSGIFHVQNRTPCCFVARQAEKCSGPAITSTGTTTLCETPISLEDAHGVLLHLNFVVPDPDGLPWPDDVWQETSIEVPRDYELFSALQDPDVNGLLTFSVGTLNSAYGQPILTLNESEHKLGAVSDFFQDPAALDRAINVTINLDLDMRLPRGSTQPPAKFSNPRRALPSADDRVVEKRLILPGYDAWDYVYVRLGTVRSNSSKQSLFDSGSILNDFENNKIDMDYDTDEVVVLDDSDTSYSKNGSIRQTQTLIGYYIEGNTRSAADLYLMKVMSWDLGDYCIGDCGTGWEPHEFSEHDEYMPVYIGVQNHDQLHEKVQEHIRNQDREPGSGVPFTPLYTHNVYKPAIYGLGGMDTSTDVVVQFVNNITTITKDLGIEVELKLPWSVQYQFASDETSTSIATHLEEELRSAGKTNSDVDSIFGSEHADNDINSHILFEKPLYGTWRLQLWVLPQPARIRKLFKFPTGRSGTTDRLDEFLAIEKVNNGDCRLYMEAHVVPSTQRKSYQF